MISIKSHLPPLLDTSVPIQGFPMSFLSTYLSLTLMLLFGNYLKKGLRTEKTFKKSDIQSENVVEAYQRVHSVGSNGII